MKFAYAPPGASTPPVTVRLDGMAPDDHIVREISRAGSFYELDLLEHLAVHAPRGGIYVDAGANIGNHTVYFARFLADRVVAVEANPDVLPVLRANLERNGLTDVDVVGCAVGAAVGQGVLVVPAGMEHNVGAWEVHADGGSAGEAAIRIRPLDDILSEALAPGERVHLIKLDVEGMELPALQGARACLVEHRPDLVVELKDDHVYAEVTGFLEPLGYRTTGRFCWTPTYVFRAAGPR